MKLCGLRRGLQDDFAETPRRKCEREDVREKLK
jgi:hypothetical protein